VMVRVVSGCYKMAFTTEDGIGPRR
jgi:hypothetical protein